MGEQVSLAISLPNDIYPDYIRTEWKLVCEFRLNRPEISPVEIAERLGFAAATIRSWLKNPDYQRYENWVLAKCREQLIGTATPVTSSSRFKSETVPERFQEYAAFMQEQLLDIVETSNSERLRGQYADRWLELAGYVGKQQAVGLTVNLTADTILMLAQRSAEAGLDFPVKVVSPSGKLEAGT